MKRSEMFLNNVTAIDFALINEKGTIDGGSLNPIFTVSGNIDEKENVVVDFSTVKKIIKDVIDHPETGYDHKTWFVWGHSNGKVYGTIPKVQQVVIDTDNLAIGMPANAIKIIEGNPDVNQSVWEVASNAIATDVADRLNELYPTADIEVTCALAAQFVDGLSYDTEMVSFRYVHGLRYSTSWGCQNIAHGHLSFLAANSSRPYDAQMVLQKIAADLDGMIFVWTKNISDPHVRSNNVTVEYETKRGKFSMVIERVNNKIALMGEETTIENIVDWVARSYRKELLGAGVEKLFVSEGLNKGATHTF